MEYTYLSHYEEQESEQNPSLGQDIKNLCLQDEIRIIEPFLPKTLKNFNSSCFGLIVILALALKVDYTWSAYISW